MAFIPAVNTAQVRVNQTLHSQKMVNTFYVLNAAAWTEETLKALADDVIAGWNEHIGPLMSGAAQYLSVSVRDMTTEEGLGVETPFPALSGGDRIGAPMPGNVALAVKLTTGFSGPNRRGRMYLGGFEEDQQDGNHLTNVARDQIVANVKSLLADINTVDRAWVIASFYNGTSLVPRPNGETRLKPVARATALLTPVTDVVADVELDSQRRRLHGRGV